jgi:hypothetical protein
MYARSGDIIRRLIDISRTASHIRRWKNDISKTVPDAGRRAVDIRSPPVYRLARDIHINRRQNDMSATVSRLLAYTPPTTDSYRP